jgi:asparagine synthase (glutamine-hydrolysing)
MCGIYGVIQNSAINAAPLAAMSRLMRHRGPDDEGLVFATNAGVKVYGGSDSPERTLNGGLAYTPRERILPCWSSGSGGLLLGHRRLSILDLSPAGHQPMSYRSRYWITFNGEIYNYLETREELQRRGHVFATGSDTEVILAAYAEWGPDCLARFNGMFAFAIYDADAGTLFLARDRFGVKPLYLWQYQNGFAFASEIKAFSALPGWRASAQRDRVTDFLIWNVSDHTTETFFQGVEQLQAGHFILVNVRPFFASHAFEQQPKLTSKRWYTLRAREVPVNDAAVQFYEALSRSIELRLRSDVPVGSCLSGGLDSSSIVCLAAQQLRRQSADPFNTFTAGSTEAAFDERKYAEAVITSSGTRAHFVVPEANGFLDELDRLIWHQDEPFPTSSIYAQWCVFRAAREQGTTVMLDGQGADEILGGYRGYFGAYLAGLARKGNVGQWLREARSMRREIGFSYVRSLGYTLAYAAPSTLRFLGRFENRGYSDRSWIRPTHHQGFERDPLHSAGGRTGSMRAMSLAQIHATNLPMLLHWEDRNSMAFSVEARVPFLDYNVVELALSLPDTAKIGGGVTKQVLRQAMRGIVPDAVLDRRDKMGFVTAEPVWMKKHQTTRFRAALEEATQVLSSLVTPNLLHGFDAVACNQAPFDHRYLRALSLASWAKQYNVSF